MIVNSVISFKLNNSYTSNNLYAWKNNPQAKNEQNSVTFQSLLCCYPKVANIILDGVGISGNPTVNPLIENMPYLKSLMDGHDDSVLFRTIEASGKFIGLDKDEPGNSEAGHGVMGSGRNIEQSMVRIDKMIDDGSFFNNPEFLQAMKHAKENNSTLHILCSIGYSHTHSKMEHIKALIEMARDNGVEKLEAHAFLNGDGPTSTTSLKYVDELDSILVKNGYPEISSIIGRGIALDKSGNAKKTEIGYKMLVDGSNAFEADNIRSGLIQALDNGQVGVNLYPIIRKGSSRISDNDAVIFANYRTDRPKALTAALAYKDSNFEFLKKYNRPQNLYFVTMTEYDPIFNLPVALKTPVYHGTVKEEFLDHGYFVTSCAQKEKHSHVTFFYNGSKDIRCENVEDIKLPGCIDPEVLPQSLREQVEVLQNQMEMKKHDKHFIVANLANGDIIGHKGNYDLAVDAARDLDKALKDLVQTAKKEGYAMVITADHGNIEDISTTKHTSNPVPCIVVLPKHEEYVKNKLIRLNKDTDKALRDIAPTLLDIAGLRKGKDMTGRSLIVDI